MAIYIEKYYNRKGIIIRVILNIRDLLVIIIEFIRLIENILVLLVLFSIKN